LAGGKRLLADYPGEPEYQADQALNSFYLGQLCAKTPGEAEAAFREAIAILGPLVARHPRAQEYRLYLAWSESELSGLLAKTGPARFSEALTAIRRSVALLVQLVRESPGNQRYRVSLALSYNNLANRLRGGGRPAEIEQAYREALGHLRQLVEEFPAVPQQRLDLAICLQNLALLLQESGRASDAEPKYQEAIATARRLAEDYPKVPGYRYILSVVLSNSGQFYLIQQQYGEGRLARAEKCLGEALAIRRQLVAESDRHTFRNSLAVTLTNLADVRRLQKQFRPCSDLLNEAVPHHQAALKVFPNNPAYRRAYRDNRRVLAMSLLDQADNAGAAAAIGQFVAFADSPDDHVLAASALARCAGLAAKDAGLTQESRCRESEGYARRAVEHMREALRKGLKDFQSIEKDPVLHALRSRADWGRLPAEGKTPRKE
jgi:tetratricopeptide (TPR) repeat protein